MAGKTLSLEQSQAENAGLKAQLEEVERKSAHLNSHDENSKRSEAVVVSGGVLPAVTPIHPDAQNIFDGDSWADAPSVEVRVYNGMWDTNVKAHYFNCFILRKIRSISHLQIWYYLAMELEADLRGILTLLQAT